MDKTSSRSLVELSKVDEKLHVLVTERKGLEQEKSALEGHVSQLRGQVNELEQIFQQEAGKQSTEESRLKEEQDKIVQRRKQLTTIGGAKSAKLIEREIDIASRQIEMMEERAVKAMIDVDQISSQLDELRSSLEEKNSLLSTRGKEIEQAIEQLLANEAEVTKERSKLMAKIEERMIRLYDRVRRRYPGDAVAIARDGACHSCFRALPPQTFNQILAGNMLISCPGCSRILINADWLE